MSPAAQNTTTPSTMIALRVRPNSSKDFTTDTPQPSRHHMQWRSPLSSRDELIAQEDSAVAHDDFVWLQAIKNLSPAILLKADFDGSPQETVPVPGHPNGHRSVTLPNDALNGHRGGTYGISNPNDKARKHSRSQLMLRIIDFGANKLPMGIGVNHRAQCRDMAFEHRVGIGRHPHFGLLAKLVGWSVRFNDIRDHPHCGQVGDCIRSGSDTRLSEQPGGGVAGDDSSGDRARYNKRGIDFAFGEDLFDFSIGLAKDANGISCGLEVAFGSLLVRRRLIEILLGASASLDELRGTRKRSLLQFEDAGACEQRRLRLQKIGAIDREQDIAELDLVAYIERCLDDFPGILGRVLNQHVLVEVNRADGGLEKCKISQPDGTDLKCGGLLVG